MANKAQINAATELYEQGVVAFDAGKYEEALSLLSRCNEIVTSPNSRMMIGRALVKLGKLPEAYRELSAAVRLAEGPKNTQKKYKKTVETAQHELDDVASKVAFLRVKSAAKVQIQGQPVAQLRSEEELVVTPGFVAVDVTYADGRHLLRQLNLKAGEHSEVEVESPAQAGAPAPQAPVTAGGKSEVRDTQQSNDISRKTLGYVAGTVGVLGIGAFVGFGVIGAASYSNAKNACVQRVCPDSAVDKEGTRSLYTGIGVTGLGIGVVGVATGAWLLLSSRSSTPSSTALELGPTGAKFTTQF